MVLHGLWWVTSDDGRFGPGVQSELYGARSDLRAYVRECYDAYGCNPLGLFIIRYLESTTVVRGVGRQARFRECALGRWGVHRVVVGFVSSVAEDLGGCPLVWVQWGFRE